MRSLFIEEDLLKNKKEVESP